MGYKYFLIKYCFKFVFDEIFFFKISKPIFDSPIFPVIKISSYKLNLFWNIYNFFFIDQKKVEETISLFDFDI